MDMAADDESSVPGEGPPDDLSGESEFVEMDPTGRYGRYDEVLGKGAYKTVYKAFDDLDGIEVAWNQVKIHDVLQNVGDMERLYSELHLLKTLKHKNIIKFYNSWVDTRGKNVNFITEIFTSGTLRQYRKKHKHVKLRAIKHWSRQILRGLVYLHSLDPPIIHRDLKCDNIFINGNNGEVKIGDLGLATILRRAPVAQSVIGTPEFMAPELYEEHYNELVDIYSFGMCLLEMLTSEYPYSECTNAAQIYKKVTMGKKPAALSQVTDAETRSFLEKCLAPVCERFHARELLMDPFLRTDEDTENVESGSCMIAKSICNVRSLDPIPEDSYFKSGQHHSYSQNVDPMSWTAFPHRKVDQLEAIPPESLYALGSSSPKEGWKRSKEFKIKGRKQDDKKVLVRIRITTAGGDCRVIQFEFDVEADTAMAVASEMVAELDLSDQDVSTIAEMIDMEIMTLIPDWKPGLAFDEVVDDQIIDEQQAPVLETPHVQEVEENELSSIGSPDRAPSTSDLSGPKNDGLMYGRFEEVGSSTTGPDAREPEPDGLGFFSDFSSGTGSDSSVNVCFDQLSSGAGVDNNPSSNKHESKETDTKSDTLPSTFLGTEDEEGHLLCMDPDDKFQDSEVSRLILQQQGELQVLRFKHEQALLDLKMLLYESLPVTDYQALLNEPEITTDPGQLCMSPDKILKGSCNKASEPGHKVEVTSTSNVCDLASTSSGSGMPESVRLASGIFNTTSNSLSVRNALEDVILAGSTCVGVSSEAENVSTVLMSSPEHVIEGHDTAASDYDANTLELNVSEDSLDALQVNDELPSKEEFKKPVEWVVCPLVAESKPKAGSDHRECGADVSRARREPEGTKSKCLPTTNEDTKPELGSLARRESYLELYKASSSKASSKSSEHLGIVEAICKTSQEQLKKQQLQKSIADFEAKTLESLSQSRNKYVVTTAMKTHTLQNGQQVATVKTNAGATVQNGQQAATVKDHPGAPSQNGQHQGITGKRHNGSILQNGQQGVCVNSLGTTVQNGQQGLTANSYTVSQAATISNRTVKNHTTAGVQNGQQSAAAKSHTTAVSQNGHAK